MTNKKPSWEDNFCKTYKDIPPSVLAMMIVDINELILSEREQAVKEAYQSPEFTDVFEYGKKQAVKNALEEVEKGLPKLTLHICRFNDGDCVCECFDNCLKLIRKLINKLKDKYN